MENSSSNLLLKLSRLLPSSCQSRTLDVEHSSIVITKHHQNITKNKNNTRGHVLLRKYPALPKSKKVTPTPPPAPTHSPDGAEKGQKCPPAKNLPLPSSSSNSAQWFTSSDERPPSAAAEAFETDTFYSLSSNSGDSLRPKAGGGRRHRRCKEMESIDKGPFSDHAATRLYYRSGCRRRSRRRRSSLGGDEAVAVEKSSSDPYGDFMASMVEMVIEKQMFGPEDLDRLLFCFLSLNKEEYHGIIFQVFSEICQTLFFN